MNSYSYTTTYTYDKANQLVSSTCDGKVTHYAYDAAGRLVKEGNKTYAYGWLDKVLSVTENGQQIASFNYHNDGQISQAIHDGKSEDFLWDGLALIHRGKTSFINEPYITGGNPVLAGDEVLFNDMLGNTLAVNSNPVKMTSFGETADKNAFFTGKPMIDELGYSFLFRDYNPNQGKWTTTDPLGYPDGWNNLAYVNNNSINNLDYQGLVITAITGNFYLSTGILDISAWVDGTLTSANRVILNAFSGDGNYRNNASYQWLSEKGPLPLGKWYIMDDLDRDDWWELWWGEDQRIDDTAQNPNGDGERTSVRFHEGHLSHGCITVAQGQVEWQIVKLWLQSMDSAFELTDYEDGALLFHGKRKGYGIINVFE